MRLLPSSVAKSVVIAPIALWITGCSCGGENEVVPIEEEEEVVLNDIGAWMGMDVMPDGSPALSYYDRDKGGLGFAIGTIGADGVEWDVEEVDGFPDSEGLNPGNRGTHTDLAITSTGEAWVSYRDEGNGALRYAHRDAAGVWTTGVADAGSGANPDAGAWTSIALDSSENPVIAHHDIGAGSLRIAHWNGSAFTAESVDKGEDGIDAEGLAIPAKVGEYAKLLISNGVEQIAYYDSANGDLKLATGTAGAYSIEVVASEGDVGAWPDLALDGSSLIISFQDVGEEDLLLAERDAEGWLTEVVDDGANRGADSAIAMEGGVPEIYSFDAYNNDLLLSTPTPDGWETTTVAGDDAAVGFHIETASSTQGRFVASYDYTNRAIWFMSK